VVFPAGRDPVTTTAGNVELRPAARLPVFLGYIAREKYELIL
jgi:hypothetical protein